jgi:hypothetical protein
MEVKNVMKYVMEYNIFRYVQNGTACLNGTKNKFYFINSKISILSLYIFKGEDT